MMLLFLITTVIGIIYTDALECYQCTNINNTANCHNVVVCQAQEKCFTRSDGAGDATTYTLGCKHEDQCISGSTVSPISIVGRSVTNQLVCSQCCSVDTCNKKLCSAGTQIVNEVGDCQDNPHFDCATISSVFSVCGDIARAKTVCRKFCGLCNVVDGGWSLWSSWGNCDVTCSSGYMTRMRLCTSPAPAHGGLNCIGNNTETKSCPLKTCPIDGSWSLWSSWCSCSVSCGVGLQRRDRSCSNPYPDRNGNHCFGDARDDRSCFVKSCQDGHWSTWSTWGTCTATCGIGLKSRIRSCDNPPPSQFGQACMGTDVDRDLCNDRACTAHHVAFAVHTPNGVLHNGVPVFTHVTTNLGGGYSTTTGIFTCPVAGLYQFSVYLYEAGSDYAYCNIQHNGVNIAFAQTDSHAIDSASVSTYVSLALGDTVKLNCANWDHVYHGNTNAFNGALINADRE